MKKNIGISVWIKIILTSIGLISSTISKAEDFYENEVPCVKINTDMFVLGLIVGNISTRCFIVEEGMEHCKEHMQIGKDLVLRNADQKLLNIGESGIQYGVPGNRSILTYHCYEDPRDKTKGLFYTPQVFILETTYKYHGFDTPQE